LFDGSQCDGGLAVVYLRALFANIVEQGFHSCCE
jgi:hypothetical protein